jgi:hypothetical protein
MQREHSQPFVIVDDGGEIFQAAHRALARLRCWRQRILIRHPAAAQEYLRDLYRNSHTPAAVIIRVHEGDDAPLVLLDWMRKQSAPLCFAPVLVVIDAEIAECGGNLDVWMENAFRHLLHLPKRRPGQELSSVAETTRHRADMKRI